VHDQSVHDLAKLVMDPTFWNERYRSSETVWSRNPNPQLVAEAAELVPGEALDIGCGEGADAICLAERGWKVTAVDVSTVALERAAAHAATVSTTAAQRIVWQNADLRGWVPPPATYDLVSAQFMQPHRTLAASVAPGGTRLIVGHHPSDLQTTVPRPPVPELFFTACDVAPVLDAEDWVVVVDEARARTTLDPDGQPATIHDAVLRAQRTG